MVRGDDVSEVVVCLPEHPMFAAGAEREGEGRAELGRPLELRDASLYQPHHLQLCVCVCVCACVHACVCVCVCVCMCARVSLFISSVKLTSSLIVGLGAEG